MAALFSIASGNSTDASTWAVAEASSFRDSEGGSQNITTLNSDGDSFTLASTVVCSGLAVKLLSAGATGVFTALLRSAGADVAGTSISVNCSVLPTLGGWAVLQFASNVTLPAGTYNVRCSCTVSNNVILYRTGTNLQLCRALITTTTAAPAAGDQFIVTGNYTGASAINSFTVTWNHTVTTIFGNVSFPQSLHVAQGGTLQLANAASTNYKMSIAGVVQNRSGTLNFGTSGSPLDSTSTFDLQFENTAVVDSGFQHWSGTTNMYGADNRVNYTLLTADVAVSGTPVQLTVQSTTGFLVGDTVVVTCTNQATRSQMSVATVSSVDSATLITISSTQFAHLGTNDANGDRRAALVNVTRNITIRGKSSTLTTYIDAGNGPTSGTAGHITLSNISLINFGSTVATAGRRGVDIRSSSVPMNATMNKVVMYIGGASNSIGINDTGSNAATTLTVTNCSIIGFATGINVGQTGHVSTYEYNLITNILNSHAYTSGNARNVFRYNRISGIVASGNVGCVNLTPDSVTQTPTGEIAYNYFGCSSYGVIWASNATGRYELHDNTYVQNTSAMYLGLNAWIAAFGRQLLTNETIISTVNTPIISFGAGPFDLISCTFTKGVGTWTNVVSLQNQGINDVRFINCTINGGSLTSITTGTLAASHTTGTIKFINCTGLPDSETLITPNPHHFHESALIGSTKHNGTNGTSRAMIRCGVVRNDTTIVSGKLQSLRITPINASGGFKTGSRIEFRVRVTSGTTISPSVMWRKSVVGDGTAYNGNQPRLCIKRNDAVGISADTVLATGTNAANGAWETLSGTTTTFTDSGEVVLFVDCDGTAGWLNVQSITVGSESNDMSVFNDGLPVQYLSGGTGGGSNAAHPLKSFAFGAKA